MLGLIFHLPELSDKRQWNVQKNMYSNSAFVRVPDYSQFLSTIYNGNLISAQSPL